MTSGRIDSGPDTAEAPPADVTAELEQARRERDAAVSKLDQRNHRRQQRHRFRRWFVGFLVALTAILIPVTVTTAWTHRTVLNTDQYVKTVGPLANDPAVTSALARIATDQVFSALDPQVKIKQALPPQAGFLAVPITNGVKGFVQDQVNKALNTEQFANLWTTANRVAHQTLVKVLNGDSKAVTTSNGQVVLSVVPLINQVLITVQQQASELLGKNITLPQLSGTELPAAACEKIGAALNRPIPSDCGQIPLFPKDKLDQAQRAVRAFNRLTVLLLVLTPLLLIATLVFSPTRRRTLLQLAIGTTLVMVIFRRAVMWLQKDLINTGKPENKEARQAIVHQLLHGYFTVTAWVVGVGLGLVVVALLAGPYRWAVRLRAWVVDGARALVRLTQVAAGRARAGAQSDATTRWVRDHLDLLRIGGAVLALLLVLVLSVSWIWLLVILALLGGYEFWLYRVDQVTRTG